MGRREGSGENEVWEGRGKVGCRAFFSIFNLLIIQISPIVPKCILFLFSFIFHLRTQFQSISCI